MSRLKNVSLALLILSASPAIAAEPPAVGGIAGNGGGGVVDQGIYKTFYSAGFYVSSKDQTETDIPAIGQLMRNLGGSPLLANSEQLMPLVRALTPSAKRKYFRVLPDSFDPEMRAQLYAEYAKVTGQPTHRMVIYAVTDPNTLSTYILPEFDRLPPLGQQAILLHESLWLHWKDATYEAVMQAEAAFQAHFEIPEDLDRQYTFCDKLRLGANCLSSVALRNDLRNPETRALFTSVVVGGEKRTAIKLSLLFDYEDIDFRRLKDFNCTDMKSDEYWAQTNCKLRVRLTLRQAFAVLTLNYPNSRFLKWTRENFEHAAGDMHFPKLVGVAAQEARIKQLQREGYWLIDRPSVHQTASAVVDVKGNALSTSLAFGDWYN